MAYLFGIIDPLREGSGSKQLINRGMTSAVGSFSPIPISGNESKALVSVTFDGTRFHLTEYQDDTETKINCKISIVRKINGLYEASDLTGSQPVSIPCDNGEITTQGSTDTQNVRASIGNPQQRSVLITIKFTTRVGYFINNIGYWISTQMGDASSPPTASTSISKEQVSQESLPIVTMQYVTDPFGCDLANFICILKSDKEYLPGYPKDLIGLFSDISIFSVDNNPYPQLYVQKPDLSSVLIDDGMTFPSLLHHVKYLYEKYPPSDYILEEFYDMLLIYSVRKYFFMGLLKSKMDVNWLLKKYNTELLELMRKSEFSKYLPMFVNPQYGYMGMETYFKC